MPNVNSLEYQRTLQKQEKAVELVDIWTAILDAGEAIKALGGSYPDEHIRKAQDALLRAGKLATGDLTDDVIKEIATVGTARAIECKPFKKTHHEQLKLVTSFGWIDFDRLRGVEQDIRDILDQAGEYVDESRKTAIISAFSSRLGQLMVLAQVQRQEDDVAQDVEQDRAQDYGFRMEL